MQQTNAWLKYVTVGLQFVLMLLLPLGLGYWADTYFETLPWGTLIGFALGATAAMVSIIRETARMGSRDGKENK
jgi:F0F1-type ATP synthase assembly protein I